MRYLGIDFGIKRVGLAVSSPAGSMAFPLKTIVRSTRQAMFDQLLEIIHELGISAVVLGIPQDHENKESLTCRQVLNFKKSLERRLDIPVYTVNEDFTTSESLGIMKECGLKKNQQKKYLDQAAAVLILQSFLSQMDETGLLDHQQG